MLVIVRKGVTWATLERVTGRKAEGAEAMTEVEFSHQLSELSNAAKDLNQESDSINALLSGCEKKISDMNVGISAAIELDGDTELRWTKLQRRVETKGSPYPSTEDYWGLAMWSKGKGQEPILKCSRDERIAALDALPELVDQLCAEAKSRVDKIKKAKTLLK